jgi:hypothetical protein
VMLSDAQIERWSRQILLPEVGGRGQARLLAARVGMLGRGSVADRAADLLRRAGVAVEAGRIPDDPEVLIDLCDDVGASAALGRRAVAAGVPLVRGLLAGAAGTVLTLVGRPCGLCVAAEAGDARAAGPLAGPAAQAVAALVAAETLGVLLARPRRGRRQRLDLLGGEFTGGPLSAGGCDVCGARA